MDAAGEAKTQNRDDRQAITVLDVIFLQGKTKGKREYSSSATRRQGHTALTGPLKSRLRLSHGRKAFRVCTGGLQKQRSFISAHVRHD